MLPVLDRVFGTLHLPRRWPEVYGVDAPVGGTLVQQIVGPLSPERPVRQDAAGRT
jgi:sterol desaturase/sphingolipid hydroxylase (fatty acid hydroxylase superfamily)